LNAIGSGKHDSGCREQTRAESGSHFEKDFHKKIFAKECQNLRDPKKCFPRKRIGK
jgi:hypothetical protein